MQGDVPQQRQISSGLKTYSSEYVILSSRELLVNFPLIISLFPLFICLLLLLLLFCLFFSLDGCFNFTECVLFVALAVRKITL